MGLEPRCRRPKTIPARTSETMEDEIVASSAFKISTSVPSSNAQWVMSACQRSFGIAASNRMNELFGRFCGWGVTKPRRESTRQMVATDGETPWRRTRCTAIVCGPASRPWSETDSSRLLVASDARAVFKAADVVASFHHAAALHGLPASLLTDNGAVFTAAPRGGTCAIELETARLGIRYVHSSPHHPQTCG